MARFQVRKDGTGFIIIPRPIWKQKRWKQGTSLSLIEGIDGSLIIREVEK